MLKHDGTNESKLITADVLPWAQVGYRLMKVCLDKQSFRGKRKCDMSYTRPTTNEQNDYGSSPAHGLLLRSMLAA